jgi:hypothetical protein
VWDTTTARGTLITAPDDTKLYDATLSENIKRKKDTVLDQQKSKSLANDIVYLFVKIHAGAAEHAEETSFVKMSDAQERATGSITSRHDLPRSPRSPCRAPRRAGLRDDQPQVLRTPVMATRARSVPRRP